MKKEYAKPVNAGQDLRSSLLGRTLQSTKKARQNRAKHEHARQAHVNHERRVYLNGWATLLEKKF